MTEKLREELIKSKDEYKYGFSDPENYIFKSKKGLDEDIVKEISHYKKEAEWIRSFRLKSLEIFTKKKVPAWGSDLSAIDFNDIYYYIKPNEKSERSWDDVPEYIKNTFDKLGIPEAERKFLGGVGAQYESEVVYHNLREDLEKQGVLFLDPDTALREYPEIFKKWFGKVIPPQDNKFAALNSAVFSGGSFIYVPKGVKVNVPLQAYFRINAKNMGQFERTLIIADEGSYVHYVEGCLPPGELVSNGHLFTNIEAVKPSDLVVSDNGEHNKVKACMTRRYKGEMITITPVSKGNSFQLTANHPVLCIKREKVLVKRNKRKENWLNEVSTKSILSIKPEYVEAGKLNVGDFIVYVTPTAIKDNNGLTKSIMKLLGLYLAEGSITHNKAIKTDVISFSFGHTNAEKALAEELYTLITRLGEKAYIFKGWNKYWTVSSYSKKLIELCLEHCGKGAKEKRLSEAIMKLPVEKQKLLLKYYLKGNGNIYVKKPYRSTMVRASTASRLLAYQLQELIARTGIFANISIRKGGKDTIQGREITRSSQYIVEYTTDKKFNEVRKKGNLFYIPVKQVNKKQYNDFVFNIEVKERNSYLVKGFAVHNCTAPTYSSDSLHSAVVELVALKGSRIRYTTIQNWSNNVYNLVTKRGLAHEDATVEWVDCNMGSKVTMKYPSVYMVGRNANAEILSLAFAGNGQHQDAGGKVIHAAPATKSTIISKSISKGTGRTSYRGLLRIEKGAEKSKSFVRCDALLLDPESRSDTYPYMENEEDNVSIGHEATVTKVADEQLFYLMSRGLTESQAMDLIIRGFIEPIVKELPMEYAVEMNRLIQLQMEGAIG